MNIIGRILFSSLVLSVTILNADDLLDYKYSIPIGSPLKKTHITSDFGYRYHPLLKKRLYHNGIDLRASMRTPVYATADGVVVGVTNSKKGYGKSIVIAHNYGFKTRYAHLNKISLLYAQKVKKGDLVGYSGNTGLSTGPHLHYDIRFGNKYLNAKHFVKASFKNFYVDINGKIPFYISKLIYTMELGNRTALNEIKELERGM